MDVIFYAKKDGVVARVDASTATVIDHEMVYSEITVIAYIDHGCVDTPDGTTLDAFNPVLANGWEPATQEEYDAFVAAKEAADEAARQANDVVAAASVAAIIAEQDAAMLARIQALMAAQQG